MKKSDRTAIQIAIAVSAFFGPLASSTINIALPTMAKDIAMNALSMGWVATTYIMAAAVFLIPFGKLADIHGRKKLFLLGTAIFTISSFLLGFARSITFLLVFRTIQGIGSGMVFATVYAIVSSLFPPGERGKALGITVACTYSGLSVGPFLGGVLTQYVGWRSVFFFNVPPGLLILAIFYFKAKKEEWAGAKGEPFDFAGSAVYCAALLSAMYGFSLLPKIWGLAFIMLGIAAMIGFIFMERAAKNPVIETRIFSENKVFTLSNIAALIHYSATFAVSFLFSLYLQHSRGLSPQVAGTILASQPVMQAIFSSPAGRLSDKVEPRIVASVGMGITAAALFLLSFTGSSVPLAYIVGCLMLLGIGFALFSSPNSNAIMSSVDQRLYSVASSTLATARVLGQMFSMGIAMLLFAVFMGSAEITPSQYSVLQKILRTALVVFGLLCVFGVYASSVRGKVR